MNDDGPLPISCIAQAASEVFGVRRSCLIGTTRDAAALRARHIAFFVARIDGHSLAEIGTYFGRRDHSTVLRACNKIAELLETDGETAVIVSQVERQARRCPIFRRPNEIEFEFPRRLP